jgi:CheY-like chemotaxis protein
MSRILVVDDEPHVRSAFELLLGEEGHPVAAKTAWRCWRQ